MAQYLKLYFIIHGMYLRLKITCEIQMNLNLFETSFVKLEGSQNLKKLISKHHFNLIECMCAGIYSFMHSFENSVLSYNWFRIWKTFFFIEVIDLVEIYNFYVFLKLKSNFGLPVLPLESFWPCAVSWTDQFWKLIKTEVFRAFFFFFQKLSMLC